MSDSYLIFLFSWFHAGDEDPAHHSDISVSQSGPDHTSLSSGPEQSPSGSVSGSSHSAVQGGWYRKYFYSENPECLLLWKSRMTFTLKIQNVFYSEILGKYRKTRLESVGSLFAVIHLYVFIMWLFYSDFIFLLTDGADSPDANGKLASFSRNCLFFSLLVNNCDITSIIALIDLFIHSVHAEFYFIFYFMCSISNLNADLHCI